MKNTHLPVVGIVVGCAFLSMAWLGAANTMASGIAYQFNTVFSGANAFSGPAPWVNATFQDTNNGVVLTIANSGLASSEFISGVYLNFDPADNVNNLSFTLQNTIGSFSAPSVSMGEDAFKADGDGYYDILLNFSTADGHKFTGGDSVTYLITGVAGLTSSDFAYLSTPGGDAPNGFYAAAHAQGLTGGQSAWIEPANGPVPIVPVPEPSPVAFVGAGIILLIALRSRSSLAKS